MRLFLDALAELAESMEMLFYVEPGVDVFPQPRDGPKATFGQRGVSGPT